MAQTGYTPIQLYYSSTTTNVPLAAKLASGELAINTYDGKLFYKDSSGVVQTIATKVSTTNSFSAGTTGLTPSTATTGAVTLAGTLITTNGGTGLSSYTAGDTTYYASGTALTKLAIGASGTIKTSTGTAPQWVASLNTSQGGTGLTTFTAGDLVYFASGTSFTKLGIGTNGQILTSSGTAPQWSAISSVGVGSITFGSTGLTPSTATSGNVSVAGTLNVSNGGTGVTASSGASSVMLRDANQNVAANSFLSNFTTVVSAGTTTTLTVASAPFYLITGSTSHTFQLPNATTLVNGTTFAFNNNSSAGSVSVNNGASSPTLIATVGSGSYTVVTLLDNSTQAGSWDKHVQAPSNVTWTTNTFNYVGSITGATWNGVAVGVLYGGTGATTVAGAQTNLQVDPAGTAVAMAIALG